MENLTSFVSSRGILKSCKCHDCNPVSSSPVLPEGLMSGHRSGDSVYVCTDALERFVTDHLSGINCPFVLVSGDSDRPVDDKLLENPSIASMLASERLLAWYAQNLVAVHPKLCHLPIGLDYHTMWATPGYWGLSASSPIAQEKCLINTLAASPDFNQRYLAGYCNWHFTMNRGDRAECHANAHKAVCFYEPRPVPRTSSWTRQAEFKFVVSPTGAGLDCHRTWEALLLGCIPIVKRGALAPLFARLPVLVVDDWRQVTRDTLVTYAVGLHKMQFDFSSLFREHWMERIAGREPLVLDSMAHQEFRMLLTRSTG
jgi:hypothetical protein